MQSSGKNKKQVENSQRSNLGRFGLYRQPEHRIKIPPKNSLPIWKHKDSHFVRVMVIVIFAVTFVLTLLTLSHASPPRSRGARPLALGRAYTAVSGDPYSLFYNPAGLHEIQQEQVAFDYGRFYSIDAPAGTEFNGTYARPFRWKDYSIPIAMGIYGERPAPGAHAIDITAGGGMDAPADRWTKGFIKFPVKIGGAVTIRHQKGDLVSNRIGKSAAGLGLTGGLLVPINKRNQVGFTLHGLFLGDSNPEGPSMHLGIYRQHTDIITLFGDLEWGNAGVWRVHPGIEWMFARGVIRPRLGWGSRDSGGIDSVATGLGVYVSPLQIDITYLIPVKTLNDNAGQFRASLQYRFGNRQFSEIYYDKALEEANQLDQRVLSLTIREAELKASLAEAEQRNRLTNEELRTLKARIELLKNQDLLGERDATIRDLKARIRQLESGLSDQRNQNAELRVKKATVRTHVVAPGDTLQNLAREYYGDPNLWKRIYNANPDKIDRGLPRVGEKLVIP